MSQGKVLFLGLFSYLPAAVIVYFLGFATWVLATYPGRNPPEPLPVLGLGALLAIGAALLISVSLALYFPTLSVVKAEEKWALCILLLAFGLITLPWFWHTRIWKRYRRDGRAH